MSLKRRWDPAVSHRGPTAEAFITSYFGQANRTILLIGGAGFDPRSTAIAMRLATAAPGRVRGLFIREERPRRNGNLDAKAVEHIAQLKVLVDYREFLVEIISRDGAVVGGTQAAPSVQQHADFGGVTDVVLDFSALSKGVSFPVARGLLDGSILGSLPEQRGVNVHAMVLEESWTDTRIVGVLSPVSPSIGYFDSGSP